MQFGRWRVGSKGQLNAVGHLYVNQAFSARLCALGVCLRASRACMEGDLQIGIGKYAAEWYECENACGNCESTLTLTAASTYAEL